jgi:hypothetical protein
LSRHRSFALAASLLALLPFREAAAQQAVPQYEYRAAWTVLANTQPVSVSVAPKAWASLLKLRPERGFRLDSPLIEPGKRKPRLDAGAVLVAMRNNPELACRLERPQFEFFVECLQETDGDGRHEGFFLLNHDKPLLFTALRQPRHQKLLPAEPVALTELPTGQLPVYDLVLFYPSGSAMSAVGGTHRFQLCVLRQNDMNLWGDKTHDRGCLPQIVVRNGEFPKRMALFGRSLEIATSAEGTVVVSVTPLGEDLPVAL